MTASPTRTTAAGHRRRKPSTEPASRPKVTPTPAGSPASRENHTPSTAHSADDATASETSSATARHRGHRPSPDPASGPARSTAVRRSSPVVVMRQAYGRTAGAFLGV